jgi:hypothetical protein
VQAVRNSYKYTNVSEENTVSIIRVEVSEKPTASFFCV